MDVTEAMAAAGGVLFRAELADEVTLNGQPSVYGQIAERGVEESSGHVVQFVEILLQPGDYPAVAYKTDQLVVGGVTYRYPKELSRDDIAVTVRWYKNMRPRVR